MAQQKKILITGGSGFIGTHLCRLLVKNGHSVTILDKVPPTEEFSFLRYIQCDVTQTKIFEEHLDQTWEAIFHFAAVVSVPECEHNPELSFSTNLVAVSTILTFLRTKKSAGHKTPALIFASSAAVYGDLGSKEKRLTESEALPIPQSFYGLHKYCAEQSIQLTSKNFDVPALSFRFFNVYGPGQKANSPYSGVITKFTEALAKEMPLQLFNHGKNERDFIHVEDIVQACLGVLSLDSAQLNGQPVNLCTGRSISIKTVAERMIKSSGKTVEMIELGPRAGDIEYSCGDDSIVSKLLPNWKARAFN